VLLGNLSQSGDNKSLETGVRLAAETGRRVWTVSGNHDCFERLDALEVAMRRVAADNVRLASPAGEVVGREPRVAGLCPMSGSRRYRARSNGGRGAEAWGDDPTVWLSPYPMVSFAEEVSSASLIYGDDLEDREEVAQPLLTRSAPTVVVSGHVRLWHDCEKISFALNPSRLRLFDPDTEKAIT
jgi:hypothetical protein